MEFKSIRRAYVLVTPELIGAFCQQGDRRIHVESPIPETATFHHAAWDSAWGAFMVFFDDDSFNPISEGCTIPRLKLVPMITDLENQRETEQTGQLSDSE